MSGAPNPNEMRAIVAFATAKAACAAYANLHAGWTANDLSLTDGVFTVDVRIDDDEIMVSRDAETVWVTVPCFLHRFPTVALRQITTAIAFGREELSARHNLPEVDDAIRAAFIRWAETYRGWTFARSGDLVFTAGPADRCTEVSYTEVSSNTLTFTHVDSYRWWDLEVAWTTDAALNFALLRDAITTAFREYSDLDNPEIALTLRTEVRS